MLNTELLKEFRTVQYGEAYFDYQKNIGAFGGIANRFKFAPFITPTDDVLDFGCGGGYLLHNLEVRQKIGIEINDIAAAEARQHGLAVYKNIADVPDEFASVIISNHALEHVECPLQILRELHPKLKAGGRAVFVVPHQKPGETYHEDDVNQHLYTWNPLTLGNLFKAAGYVHIQVDTLRHQWPPNYVKWYQRLGQDRFDTLCWLYAIYKRNYQIRAVAEHT